VHDLNPVVLIYARTISPPLTSLVKQIDEATAKNTDLQMGSFVTFCTDEEGFNRIAKDLAKKEKIEHTAFTRMGRDGPRHHDIHPEAEITVLLYVGAVVKANHAFRKGEMKDGDIKAILDDLPKILKTMKPEASGRK